MNALARVSFRSAVLGFAVTAAFVAYQLISDSHSIERDSRMMLVFVILCPPSLLVVPFIDIEVGTNRFYLMWTIIGLLNAALYTTVRAFITRRLKRVD